MKLFNYLFWTILTLLFFLLYFLIDYEHLLIFISCLFIILSLYFSIVYTYNLLISLFGYINIKRDYLIKNDKTKFLIMVAAHNEELVIKQTILNLKKINYDNELFDICIVSDNSTDHTTEIALKENVKVVDTIQGKYKREGVGKPAGIQYALREMGFNYIKKQYDMIMILDADNFVSQNILKEVNSQYIMRGKPTAIQVFLDSKNYSKFMSLAYTVVFWTNNRFMQLAKYRLGIPNSIGGTGFFIDANWIINNGGFKFDSLTEDLEMEIEIVKNGGRILWNDHASIYDEKPESTRISMKQRHRWIKGHWYVAFKEILNLLIKFLLTLNIKYLDKIFFLMSMGKAFQMFLVFIIFIVNIIIITQERELSIFLNQLNLLSTSHILNEYVFYFSNLNMFLIFYSFVFLPLYSVYTRIRKINPFNVVFSLFWFLTTELVIEFLGLFTWPYQSNWVKTPHTKIEIETINETFLHPENYESKNSPVIDIKEINIDKNINSITKSYEP